MNFKIGDKVEARLNPAARKWTEVVIEGFRPDPRNMTGKPSWVEVRTDAGTRSVRPSMLRTIDAPR